MRGANHESTNYTVFFGILLFSLRPNVFLLQNNYDLCSSLNVGVQFSFVTLLLPLCSIFAEIYYVLLSFVRRRQLLLNFHSEILELTSDKHFWLSAFIVGPDLVTRVAEEQFSVKLSPSLEVKRDLVHMFT